MQNRFKLKLLNIFRSPSGSCRTRNLSDEIEKAAPEIRQVESALVRRIAEHIQLMEETVEEFTDSGIDPLTVSRSSCHSISGLCRTLKPDSLSTLSSSKSSSSSSISFSAGSKPEPIWQNRLQLLARLEHQVRPTIFFLFVFESRNQAAKPDRENTLGFFQEFELAFEHGGLRVHTKSRGMSRVKRVLGVTSRNWTRC